MLQEPGPDRPEQTLYFAAPLGRIGSRMDQGNTERSTDPLEVPGAERSAVVDIEFAGQSPGKQGLAKGAQPGCQPFREKELAMGNQP